MKVIDQSWEWMQKPLLPLELIEQAGRTCYKSEDLITPDSARGFVQRIMARGHESVIEHVSASVKFITDRGVTHELVRHRLCAFSQESTRYCNYGGDHLTFIRPVWMEIKTPVILDGAPIQVDPIPDGAWFQAMSASEAYYKYLLLNGWRPEQARAVLPNSLKTEIVVTANVREWRHIFNLRCSKAAHPQIRELMLSCLVGFWQTVPVLFDDLAEKYLEQPLKSSRQS
jgi:thymidylate synthase (FAD)